MWRSKGPTPPSEPTHSGNKALFLVILPIICLQLTWFGKNSQIPWSVKPMVSPPFPTKHYLDGWTGVPHNPRWNRFNLEASLTCQRCNHPWLPPVTATDDPTPLDQVGPTTPPQVFLKSRSVFFSLHPWSSTARPWKPWCVILYDTKANNPLLRAKQARIATNVASTLILFSIQ